MPVITQPVPFFADLDGSPLDNGRVYFGTTGANPVTSPATVYWDDALTQPVAQPAQTMNGVIHRSGTPAVVYSSGSVSMLVQNSAGAQILYAASVVAIDGTLRADLANTATANLGSKLIGWLRSAASAVATTLKDWLGWQEVNVFEFMTAAQIADVQGYTYAIDVSTPILNAINAARTLGGYRVRFPAGGYLASIDYTVLAQGGSTSLEYRGIPLTLVGDGNGESFVVASNLARGTIIRAVGTAPAIAIKRDPLNAFATCGTVTIKGIRFEANNTTYAAELESLCAQSLVENITVYQTGTGGGLRVKQMSTGLIHQCHFLGPRWLLGAPFTGHGFYLEQSVNNNGLPSLHKCTSRGWQWSYVIGNGTIRTYSPTIAECESSVCENGIWLKPYTSGAVVTVPYFEGITNTCVLDQGEDTGIYDGEFLLGFTTGIDGTFSGLGGSYGRTYSNNYLEADDAGGGTKHLIRVESTGAFGGPGCTVSDNRFVYNGAGAATVHGITIQGIDPRISMPGNQFLPRGSTWAAPGKKLNDISTTPAGTGTGLYGFGVTAYGDYEFPLLSRGALSLGINTTALTQTAVAANVLTVSGGSYEILTPTVGVVINSIAAPLMDGKVLWLRVTNANVTFTNGATIKLAGSVNYTPGANGALIGFIIRGNVAEEFARVAY